MKTRYFYNGETGDLITKSTGDIHLIPSVDCEHIDLSTSVNITEYKIDLNTLQLIEIET